MKNIAELKELNLKKGTVYMKKRDKEIIIKNGKTKSIINKQASSLTATNVKLQLQKIKGLTVEIITKSGGTK